MRQSFKTTKLSKGGSSRGIQAANSLLRPRRLAQALTIAALVFYLGFTRLVGRDVSLKSVSFLRNTKERESYIENGWDLEPRPIRLELQSPIYSLRILRSILQHSNNTWQDMEGEAQGYFIQSLLWLQIVS